MKIFKGWEKSNLNREEYLQVGDEIDEELFLDIAESVSLEYCDENFVQNGEPDGVKKSSNGGKVYYHETAFQTQNGKYFYLGSLPSFNNL